MKILGGTEVEIIDKKYHITPGIRTKSMSDKNKVVFRDLLQKTIVYNHKPTKGRVSGRDRYIKNKLDKDVRRILILDTKLDGRGIEKIIKPANIIDIYTRLEVILGLKLTGHTDTLTEASNLIHEFYKKR